MRGGANWPWRPVDLRGVEPGGPGWEAARAAVTIGHDALPPDLRRELFGCALPELFALPLEVKERTTLAMGKFQRIHRPAPRHGLGEPPRREPTDAANVRAFTGLLWLEGNPEFWGQCERQRQGEAADGEPRLDFPGGTDRGQFYGTREVAASGGKERRCGGEEAEEVKRRGGEGAPAGLQCGGVSG